MKMDAKIHWERSQRLCSGGSEEGETGRRGGISREAWNTAPLLELFGTVLVYLKLCARLWDMLDLNMIWGPACYPLWEKKDPMSSDTPRRERRKKRQKQRKIKRGGARGRLERQRENLRVLEKKGGNKEGEKESWKRKITPNRIFMNVASYSFMLCCRWWWDLDTRAPCFLDKRAFTCSHPPHSSHMAPCILAPCTQLIPNLRLDPRL